MGGRRWRRRKRRKVVKNTREKKKGKREESRREGEERRRKREGGRVRGRRRWRWVTISLTFLPVSKAMPPSSFSASSLTSQKSAL